MGKKRTVFQALDSAISGNWGNVSTPVVHNNSYDMSSKSGNNILYKTRDKDDYEQKKLELQQNRFLKERWVKANINTSVTAFAGLNNVKLMYRDADLMDAFPEIGAALDIVSEESCLNSTDNGMVVTVQSKSERVKSILEDLFVNRLNLQLTAQMVVRAMCKYGNQFMLLDIDHKNGVKGWKQLPVFNVERIENGIQNPYCAGASIAVNGTNIDDADLSTQFVWLDDNNSQMPFRDWQIAHFRLLTNSLYLPYGCLVGDTRVETEHGFKEIKDLNVLDKVWTFNIESQERELASVIAFMPKGKKDVYKLTTRHNYIEGTLDHKILCVVDGELEYKEIGNVTVEDIVAISEGNSNGVDIEIDKTPYEYKNKGGKKWFENNIHVVPKYVNEELAELFGFMIGDGSITYDRIITMAGGVQKTFNDKYQYLIEKYSNSKGTRHYREDGSLRSITFSSRLFGEIFKRLGFKCGFSNKRIPSWVFESKSNIKKAFIRGLINADGYMFIDTRKKNASIRYDIELENEQLIKDLKILVQSLGWKSGQIYRRHREPHFSKKIGKIMRFSSDSFMLSFYETPNKQVKSSDTLKDRKNGKFILERVTSVSYVGEKETYDITVSNNNSNFIANGIITHNCSYLNAARRHWRMLSLMEDMMLIYRLERSVERRVYKIFVGAIDDADVGAYVEQIANEFKRTPIVDPITGQLDLRKNILGIDQDIFIPVRSEDAPTPIDTLSAGQNMTALDDIKFVQNKVLTALRIPKSFLNFEESAGDGKNLALMDIRFTRTINRIQQAFLMELTKVASIHLFLLGFDDDLNNFTLSMKNPSTQAEQLEIENMQKKIDAARDAVSDPGNGLPIMSTTRALKQIMKWSEKDIKENFEEIRLEKGIAAELEKTTQIIKKTGIFDTVDRIYGEPGAEYVDDQQGGMGDDMQGGAPSGGGMAPPPMGGENELGGELDTLGQPGQEDMGDISGQEGSVPTQDMPTDDSSSMQQVPMESTLASRKPLLKESSGNKLDTIFDKYMKKVISESKESLQKDAEYKRAEVYDKSSLLMNEEFDKMISSLGKFVDKDNK